MVRSKSIRLIDYGDESRKHTPRDTEVQFNRPISDMEKVHNYLKNAKVRGIRNKEHLFQKLADLFRIEPDNMEEIWSNLVRKYPVFIREITSRFQDEVLRRRYEQANYEALHPKRKKATDHSEIVLERIAKNEDVSLKDVKRINGVEYEWTQGKLTPIEQKSYRSKFDEQ